MSQMIENHALFFNKEKGRDVIEVVKISKADDIEIVFFKDTHNKNDNTHILTLSDFLNKFQEIKFKVGDILHEEKIKREYLITSIKKDGYGFNDDKDTYFFWSAESYLVKKEISFLNTLVENYENSLGNNNTNNTEKLSSARVKKNK